MCQNKPVQLPYQQVAFTLSHFWLLYTYWGDQSLFSHFLLVSLLNFPFVLIIYHFVVLYVGALVYPLNFQVDCFSKQNFINLKTLVSFPKRNAWSSIFHLLLLSLLIKVLSMLICACSSIFFCLIILFLEILPNDFCDTYIVLLSCIIKPEIPTGLRHRE